MPREKGEKMIARNKKALHDYAIGERLEAGIVLTGTEVKSLRDGRASLVDAFATIDNDEELDAVFEKYLEIAEADE